MQAVVTYLKEQSRTKLRDYDSERPTYITELLERWKGMEPGTLLADIPTKLGLSADARSHAADVYDTQRERAAPADQIQNRSEKPAAFQHTLVNLSINGVIPPANYTARNDVVVIVITLAVALVAIVWLLVSR
ncbi:hypothetical protein LTR78_001488 [Recurvomyces mirabilis]|uniref:Uncharacterized protein n=1 Tax=Recurvomyces mirabilis TaxID=574656 RepID=A0AAE1C5Q5_9PEZI|nr:hypothetical protein LTR78_001488 [Recurvomyces mirabilis]KAK5161467.1 hypothetical protein LTS14_001263 [Recurvomyces mirabilis]